MNLLVQSIHLPSILCVAYNKPEYQSGGLLQPAYEARLINEYYYSHFKYACVTKERPSYIVRNHNNQQKTRPSNVDLTLHCESIV